MCSHHNLAVLVSSLVSLSDESIAPTPTTQQDAKTDSGDTESGNSMQEFYQLFQRLLVITLVLTGVIFISVWIFYSLNIALNYLIGACTGVVYLKMLARDVEQLGSEKASLSKTRFALFIGVMIVATQWRELQILPIFLGFLTYKATLLVYMVQIAFLPDS
ncbi:ATP synthase subunit I [Nostoc punctiforme]|jgi:ATP synthase protein I|uniref:Ptuative ATP synthase protein I n=1 Tax=Nostoc punctiforme (strain ATCC 29133 / PCC 73102) TaxID=63737 RepID=B2J052_NOSP7|nr:ATP synthase subunit I [Nostoc punctiforme]ACC83204.1 ptuative ATP synthase protein I [Nostoc punctiforme PCC 73102]